ncbi:MAG: hypothetical protein LUF83_01870 [Alistipes sp.]|nr:hypothetical protein [Alistipes sp.]
MNDFYFQFQKLANNYNQVVKAFNSHFSNIAIPHQIALLEQRTRELKALSIEILNLAKQAKKWLRIYDLASRPAKPCITTSKRPIKMRPRCFSGRKCWRCSISTNDWMSIPAWKIFGLSSYPPHNDISYSNIEKHAAYCHSNIRRIAFRIFASFR